MEKRESKAEKIGDWKREQLGKSKGGREKPQVEKREVQNRFINFTKKNNNNNNNNNNRYNN